MLAAAQPTCPTTGGAPQTAHPPALGSQAGWLRLPATALGPAACLDLQAARRRNEATGGLPTLPLELIEAICRPLSMKDRWAPCVGEL